MRFGKGYSVDNLENMRKFYLGYPSMFKKSETVSRILSWSHYCELMKEDFPIVSAVPRQLEREYGAGFSVPNLSRMVRFAECYTDEKILSTLSKELSWSHFVAMISIPRDVPDCVSAASEV